VAVLRARRPQAASPDLAAEIDGMIADGADRVAAIRQAITSVGGVPDVVGELMATLGTSALAGPATATPIDQSLLAELSLQHQLLERVRYARALAQRVGHNDVVQLAKRVENAHAARVTWTATRLGELAAGGPVDLRPTPTQVVADLASRLASLPGRRAVATLNDTVAAVRTWRSRATEAVTSASERTRRLASAAADVWAAGRDASLAQAEEEASADGSDRAVRVIRRARVDLGALSAEELPIDAYDDLPVSTIVAELRALASVDDVRAVLAYEAANRNRKRVVDTAQNRVAELGRDLIGA
jgi:hypothetical protein